MPTPFSGPYAKFATFTTELRHPLDIIENLAFLQRK